MKKQKNNFSLCSLLVCSSVLQDKASFNFSVSMLYLIQDPRGNMLSQWLSLDSVLGVVSQEYQLSENPPLGEWTIITTVEVSLLPLTQTQLLEGMPNCK